MKTFIIILLFIGVSVIAGPVASGLILITLVIAENVYNEKLNKQRQEQKASEDRLIAELAEIKEKEKVKKEIKVAVENLKNAIHEHEVKKKKKISNKETIYMMRGKKHIFDGENFIEIDEEEIQK